MKLFKEVIKNNLKMIIFYVLIGIIINFLDLYSVTYYQKILDSFQFKTLTLTPLIIYGLLLIISTILGYVENYPEQQVKNKLYLAIDGELPPEEVEETEEEEEFVLEKPKLQNFKEELEQEEKEAEAKKEKEDKPNIAEVIEELKRKNMKKDNTLSYGDNSNNSFILNNK